MAVTPIHGWPAHRAWKSRTWLAHGEILASLWPPLAIRPSVASMMEAGLESPAATAEGRSNVSGVPATMKGSSSEEFSLPRSKASVVQELEAEAVDRPKGDAEADDNVAVLPLIFHGSTAAGAAAMEAAGAATESEGAAAKEAGAFFGELFEDRPQGSSGAAFAVTLGCSDKLVDQS
jgi:hypothetical protein